MTKKYYKLSVVATPIGNLSEISELARKTLSQAQLIICEDTRVTKKLLHLLNINNNQKLVSYNKITEKEKTTIMLQHLKKYPCVLVSDAGYPVISDPGFHLINYLRKNNGLIEIINGPCALIHALVGSGIDSRKFYFANFLTKKKVQRMIELKELKNVLSLATVIYYEPMNYVKKGLEVLLEVFGDIKIVIARELSKINETFYFDKISEIKNQIKLKGEFVIIIPKQDIITKNVQLESLLNQLNLYLNDNISLKSACKLVANAKYSASEIYKFYLINKRKNNEKK